MARNWEVSLEGEKKKRGDPGPEQCSADYGAACQMRESRRPRPTEEEEEEKNMEGGWASIVINIRHGVDIFLLSIDTTKK